MNAFFASPAALWLGLLIGPLLLLYMLRHKPVRKRMPSIVLWVGVAQAQIATSPFQRLRRSLSLLLMLLALIALVLALSGFRIPGGEQRGVPVTIVVDVTASMRAYEKGGTRLDLARQRAADVIEDAGNSAITLFTWDGNLRAVGPSEAEPSVARGRLDDIEAVQYGSSDAALVRALDQLGEKENQRVILISDHAPGQMKKALFVPAGLPKMNVGIVSASLSEITASQVDLFFGLDLHGSERAVTVPLVLERVVAGGDDQLVDARDISVVPDQRTSVTFSKLEPGLYRAHIKLDDGLALDNEAYVRFSKLPVQDVVMTGEQPEALTRAVEAIEQTMGVIRVVPSGMEDQANASYIFADEASTGAVPRLPSAYMAPNCTPPGIAFGEEVDVDDAATRPANSFLWRGAGTPDIRIPKVREIDTSRYLRPVLEAGTGPAVALAPRENGLQDLIVAFPLDQNATGFTGKLAFVIFWANWFDYVRRVREPLPRGAVSTRETMRIRPLLGRGDFRYGAIDAEELSEGSPGLALQFDKHGVYRFEGLEDTDLPLVGVSLLDAQESNLTTADANGYDADAVNEWMQGFEGDGERRDLDLRPWLALLAGALLLFDWFWFRRKFPTKAEAPPPAPKAQTAIRRHTARVRA
ncbi:MAG: VWA domain-containing protein [Planctomycetes bacterium]|nr:VWA domain-containing protein [Planctomycetota bacterium]